MALSQSKKLDANNAAYDQPNHQSHTRRQIRVCLMAKPDAAHHSESADPIIFDPFNEPEHKHAK